ncbi:MAG: acyltransferase domain-containing protein, partial [bacterium]|nr:acyltransferase domain-containing protein [bacterium]
GGTNVHVILEEWPGGDSRRLAVGGRQKRDQLILLSAKTPSVLEKMSENLAGHFKKNPHTRLTDAAYTLQVGREAFNHRKMAVCANVEEAARKLSSNDPRDSRTAVIVDDTRPVVFMFPGQGAQYVDMGRELYQKEPVFREEIDRCFELLNPIMGINIKEILYPEGGLSGGVVEWGSGENPSVSPGLSASSVASVAKKIHQTEITQPVIFAFEYALAKLLIKWGIKPHA